VAESNSKQPPQQFQSQYYSYSIDYFAFSLTIYEMATGKRLLSAIRRVENETNAFYESQLKPILDVNLKDLIVKLLKIEEVYRIGTDDIEEITRDKYFTGNDFIRM